MHCTTFWATPCTISARTASLSCGPSAAPRACGSRWRDDGPGIAADDLPYIFDRYYRSRSDAGKQGTGLGLSITKAIFQQHGFRFGVQSAIGMGTTFWFVMNDLPANEKKTVEDRGGENPGEKMIE
ncbi:ATP-binding protein [Faecalibacterium sp. 7]|uniref:ATP-binding protein n=1 Tax=Faecalibacterium sp. 7 TaxID=3402017 RepID=UPI003C2BC953